MSSVVKTAQRKLWSRTCSHNQRRRWTRADRRTVTLQTDNRLFPSARLNFTTRLFFIIRCFVIRSLHLYGNEIPSGTISSYKTYVKPQEFTVQPLTDLWVKRGSTKTSDELKPEDVWTHWASGTVCTVCVCRSWTAGFILHKEEQKNLNSFFNLWVLLANVSQNHSSIDKAAELQTCM